MMKKMLLVFIIFLIFVSQIYGQDDLISQWIANLIDTSISAIGGSVPDGFRRSDRTTFINDDSIILITENGIVVLSAIVYAWATTHEAHEFNGLLYDYFENNRNNWRFIRSTYNGTDIYLRNGIYAGIQIPSRRDDGMIASLIGFSRNIDDL